MRSAPTLRLAVLVAAAACTECVIYDLDDAAYDQMPPLFGLEEYHSCLRMPAGTYCLAQFDLYADTTNELIHMIHDFSAFNLKHYNHTYIQRGICVTRSCKKYVNQDLSRPRVLEACLNDAIFEEYGINATLAAIYYCDTKEDAPVADNYDWGFLAAFLVILMINIAASVRKIYMNQKKEKSEDRVGKLSFLDHFAVQTNWEKLVSPQSSIKHIRSLHGIRCIAMFFIIFGHCMWLIEFGFVDNPHDFEKGYDSPIFKFIFNGMMLVQVFFVLSGFLFANRLLYRADDETLTWNLVPRMIAYRWVRLSPALIATIWLSATWLRTLGSGPLWNLFVTNSVVSDCRKYWWLHLLYVNNIVPEDRFCALHTWYIAADFQLHLICLVAIIWWTRGLSKRHLKTSTLAVVAVSAGIVAPAVHVWWRGLFPLLVLTPEFHRTFADEHYHWLHRTAHANLPGFLAGVVAARLVRRWNKLRSAPRFPGFTLLASILAALAVEYSGSLWYDHDAAGALRLLHAGLHRGLFAAAVAMAVVSSLYGDGILQHLLRWSGWTALSRLSYCTYLLHVPLLSVLVGSKSQLAHVSMLYVIVNHLGVVCLSVLLSLPLHVLLEAPTLSLLRAALPAKTADGSKVGRIGRKKDS